MLEVIRKPKRYKVGVWYRFIANGDFLYIFRLLYKRNPVALPHSVHTQMHKGGHANCYPILLYKPCALCAVCASVLKFF